MALKHGDKHFCMFTFNENGRPYNRRVHEITVQAERVFRIEGEDLPSQITVHTGTTSTGHNAAEIICNPSQKSRGRYVLTPCTAWPKFRDVVNWFLCSVCLLMLQFIVGLIMDL